jgi:hypothetical protein
MKSSRTFQTRPCIVLTFELLGLEEPAGSGKVLKALALVERHLRDDVEENSPFEKRLFIVGHHVLRVAPIKQHGTLLFWELLDVVHLQLVLVANGILLRGALTFGDVVLRTDLAVGPAVSEAERLRNEVAQFPRVIVDPRLIQAVEDNPHLRKDGHTVPMELGFIRSLLREDADGLWFVDYLKAVRTELDDSSMYPDFLADHRRLIEEHLASATTLDASARAWTWLWRYHNRIINQVFKEEGKKERERLLSPARSPLVFAFPPSARAPSSE